jgi:hypothetical protein
MNQRRVEGKGEKVAITPENWDTHMLIFKRVCILAKSDSWLRHVPVCLSVYVNRHNSHWMILCGILY